MSKESAHNKGERRKKQNGMARKLTETLISSYIRIGDHGKEILRTFAETFRDSTIEFLSKQEITRREEERNVPAIESQIEPQRVVSAETINKAAAPVAEHQARLF